MFLFFILIFSFGCKPNCFISNIIVAEKLRPVVVEEGAPVLSYHVKAGLLLGRLMKACGSFTTYLNAEGLTASFSLRWDAEKNELSRLTTPATFFGFSTFCSLLPCVFSFPNKELYIGHTRAASTDFVHQICYCLPSL